MRLNQTAKKLDERTINYLTRYFFKPAMAAFIWAR
jgi:hypothetical protein